MQSVDHLNIDSPPLPVTCVKPHIYKCAEWFANCSRMVCEPNACMCGWDCNPALRHLQTFCIPFAANQNLSVFLGEHKENWMRLHAPGVLCSPQVHEKLITCALPTHCTRMAQHVNSTLVYIKLKKTCVCSRWRSYVLVCMRMYM